MKNVCISIEPEFENVVDIADVIRESSGLSRSLIFTTILHEYFSVPTCNPTLHKKFLADINAALGRV